mgnify:CR=1 FL=1
MAIGFVCLYVIFYMNEGFAWYHFDWSFDESAYFGNCHADADSSWCAMVAMGTFDNDTFRDFLFHGMVCRKNISGGNPDVWQKTNLERIIQMAEVLGARGLVFVYKSFSRARLYLSVSLRGYRLCRG